MKQNKTLSFITCIATPLVVGILSSLLAGDIPAKYALLKTPPLSPPNFVFGIAWTILYILMGFAVFLVLHSNASKPDLQVAIVLFVVQLFINFIWSPTFFRLNMLWLAFALIVILDILVIFCARIFHTLFPFAGWLMVPYILWLLFATYLTLGSAILN